MESEWREGLEHCGGPAVAVAVAVVVAVVVVVAAAFAFAFCCVVCLRCSPFAVRRSLFAFKFK